MITSPDAGLYVHVPFCARLCSYCDFYKIVGDGSLQDRWIDAILREAEIRGAAWIASPFDNIFMGGGTPSHLGPERLDRLVRGFRARLAIRPGAEWTMEANPESASEELLAVAREAGINRLSIGVQSLDDAELAGLGRLHDAAGACAAVERARRTGFENLSLDLIYGLPDRAGVDVAWERTLSDAIGLQPDHISAYLLTLEPGVAMAASVARGTIRMASEDRAVADYSHARGVLAAAGYERYEISNWARPGFHCRHNLNVWRGGVYLGLGPGAHGYDGIDRRANHADLSTYLEALEAGLEPPATIERIGPRTREEEAILLGLRLREGIPWTAMIGMLGPDRTRRLRNRVAYWTGFGYLVDDGDRFWLGEDGLFVSNALIADLLGSL